MKEKFNVAGIGELLWDVFPTHKSLGGAPANFACHCNRLGATASLVSCIGADPLGELICNRLRETGVDTLRVMESDMYPTGTVKVVLNAGKPTYEIREDVAWDHITCGDELKTFAATLDAVCFGSLSQRAGESRAAIRSFLQHVPDGALKFFDVNLRQNFFSKELIEDSLCRANILKLSDEELPVLAGYFGLQGDTLEQLHQLHEIFSLRLIAYTRGSDGSVLVSADEVDDSPGLPVKVVDTVGAGDSFTAALCMGLLRGWPLKKVNAFANEVATFVCSQKGATPVLPGRLVAYGVEMAGEDPS
ncbi:carbohydrate kinase [Desulforhopalus vacuolatus]|uniref:carbohydrate kinase family protein n=1 Tax=Desulforhopalus vacuolatus TaxID=40414 RepID=UPI0019663733|nr:carbohydrate kinase [Desulforhopalus vacuolatus]MBM9520107.1 carbohydrate kinase [Desulforhopalus vacuolatus]